MKSRAMNHLTASGAWALLMILALSAIPAFAMPGLNKLQARFSQIADKRLDKSEDCVNFSGDWIGQCTEANGEIAEAAMTIEQVACSSLGFHGEDESYQIGGLKTETDSSAMFAMSTALGVNWHDETKSRLDGTVSLQGQVNVFPVNFQGAVQLAMYMDGSELVNDVTVHVMVNANGTPQTTIEKSTCRYVRK